MTRAKSLAIISPGPDRSSERGLNTRSWKVLNPDMSNAERAP
jgi:hypothetical protein